MPNYWFRIRKNRGWYPTNFLGWLVVFSMAISIIFSTLSINSTSIFTILIMSFPLNCLIVALAVFISAYKGERPVFGKENRSNASYNRDNPKAYLFLTFFFILIAILYFATGNFTAVLEILLVLLLIYLIADRIRSEPETPSLV